ncbi:hypothetical protein PRZ48_005496 [Zasmidium cellare]|uniref:Xylanolytic transcriptional activator regulatory domain-containing protein n=1 Tax=Zasmidium cellare TaxID=395010 RepID=A0ABR0ETJ4_ZASCE|nr:hypothetical protein PRZ48_005496 [Zasmidium cellare]
MSARKCAVREQSLATPWIEEPANPSQEPTGTPKRRRTHEAEGDEAALTGGYGRPTRQDLSTHGHGSGSSSANAPDVGGESTISIARKIYALRNQQSDYDHAVDAIPGANDSPLASKANVASTASYLTFPLPGDDEIQELLGEYFASIHWFSLVIVTTKFTTAYENVRAGYATALDKPFLLLLSTVLGLSAWYRAHRASTRDERNKWQDLSKKMVLNAELQLVDVMDQRSITAIQTLILLGSYYVYHGRPNLSFSLVGATIKAAQSMSLHKSCPQANHLDREERKRVWWTIYTWDRFSSVNYGQPFGISEKVCNVEQPEDLLEVAFDHHDQAQSICFSTYQRELNKLYLIASPAIESLYRVDDGKHPKATKDYQALVRQVTAEIWNWRRDLPSHLLLNLDEDLPASLSAEAKAYTLQALSLYLTFDSLILVLHRPFMKQRLDSMTSNLPSAEHSPTPPTTSDASSHEQLWNAAVRTAKIAELPQLASHATNGHLINFLMMNMFNAAVVLIVVALSQPLTDRAQQAKRTVARVYRMQSALEDRSVLSKQSAAVLRNLVQLLISRESDAILAPMTVSRSRATHGNDYNVDGRNTLTVRDALSNFETAPFGLLDGSSAVGPQLEAGLESVQRAFAGNPAQAPSSHNQSHRPSITPGEYSLQEATDQQIQATGPVDFGVDWHNLEPGADMGVHWIWDPAWDNLFDQVEM